MPEAMASLGVSETNSLTERTMSGAINALRQPKSDDGLTKITKSARQFEAILLTKWLEEAEKTFATVPGGDDSKTDPGREQFQGIAMQTLATSVAEHGGFGIAPLIVKYLQSSEDRSETKTNPAGEAASASLPPPTAEIGAQVLKFSAGSADENSGE
jgi:Rod binding domain-containing protein